MLHCEKYKMNHQIKNQIKSTLSHMKEIYWVHACCVWIWRSCVWCELGSSSLAQPHRWDGHTGIHSSSWFSRVDAMRECVDASLSRRQSHCLNIRVKQSQHLVHILPRRKDFFACWGKWKILRKKSANTRNPGWYYATCTENTRSALITRIIETIYMYLYNSYSNNNTIILWINVAATAYQLAKSLKAPCSFPLRCSKSGTAGSGQVPMVWYSSRKASMSDVPQTSFAEVTHRLPRTKRPLKCTIPTIPGALQLSALTIERESG